MEKVQFVNNALALQSLRDSDFDVYSAYGEVIDNSIQAKASWIKVHFNTIQAKKNYSRITEVIFSDNGEGMDKDTLHKCMQMGFSSRYNDRSGIGRFGVGMTLSSINQCKKIEIYSRKNTGKWLWTYIDLDEIIKNKVDSISEPIEKDLPKEYQKFASDSSGTIVIWEKYDRQPETADKIIKESHIWFGRTYRYFIWDGISIFINNEEVKAIDPLYVRTDKTKFPNDPKATEYPPISFQWVIPKIDRAENSPELSTITIRMSILPEELRSYQGVGGSSETEERYIDRNEGISIVRNKREVFYGHIPYFKPKFDEKDRWWGCEIYFNAILDKAFTVKNIKRGAVPSPDLREAIEEKINPTRKQIKNIVSSYWKKMEELKQKKAQEGELPTGHEQAETIAANTPTDKSAIDKDKDPKEEAKKIVENDDVLSDYDEIIKQKWAVKFASQPFTIIDSTWRGSGFCETNHLGGKDVIKYNKNHPFIDKLYAIVNEIEKEHKEDSNAMDLKILIDLLIISYSKAESRFEKSDTMPAERFIENIRSNWGYYLESYLRSWLETKYKEENNNDKEK